MTNVNEIELEIIMTITRTEHDDNRTDRDKTEHDDAEHDDTDYRDITGDYESYKEYNERL